MKPTFLFCLGLAAALSLSCAAGSAPLIDEDTLPPTPENLRIGGDLEAEAVWNPRRGGWSSGDSFIDTPLPEGYPAPTPPGAIEIKIYPAVRRAEFTATQGRSSSGFMPLFRHIQRNDIAMTSPVEMDYASSGEWTMSFLYRTADLHPTGSDPEDERIIIRDIEPLTVISLGGRGTYDNSRIQRDLATLKRWLEDHPEWQITGEGRALLYNGPTWRPWLKWLEVQIPVTRVETEAREEESTP